MKVGNYVRTKYGYICKIININDCREPSMKYGVEASYVKDVGFLGDEDIIKSSPNIIDLIEVGDYVDRLRVTGKQEDYIEVETFDEKIIIYKNEHIKSVLTKEQFERMEYKIGE